MGSKKVNNPFTRLVQNSRETLRSFFKRKSLLEREFKSNSPENANDQPASSSTLADVHCAVDYEGPSATRPRLDEQLKIGNSRQKANVIAQSRRHQVSKETKEEYLPRLTSQTLTTGKKRKADQGEQTSERDRKRPRLEEEMARLSMSGGKKNSKTRFPRSRTVRKNPIKSPDEFVGRCGGTVRNSSMQNGYAPSEMTRSVTKQGWVDHKSNAEDSGYGSFAEGSENTDRETSFGEGARNDEAEKKTFPSNSKKEGQPTCCEEPRFFHYRLFAKGNKLRLVINDSREKRCMDSQEWALLHSDNMQITENRQTIEFRNEECVSCSIDLSNEKSFQNDKEFDIIPCENCRHHNTLPISFKFNEEINSFTIP